MAFGDKIGGVTDYVVTIVWNIPAEGWPDDFVMSVPGSWVASSDGCLVTGVPVSGGWPLTAGEDALNKVVRFVDTSKALPVAMTIDPVSATPHFMLAAYGR